jgi:hypothetical protein
MYYLVASSYVFGEALWAEDFPVARWCFLFSINIAVTTFVADR